MRVACKALGGIVCTGRGARHGVVVSSTGAQLDSGPWGYLDRGGSSKHIAHADSPTDIARTSGAR